MKTGRAISAACAPLAPLCPGSTAMVAPASDPAARGRDVVVGTTRVVVVDGGRTLVVVVVVVVVGVVELVVLVLDAVRRCALPPPHAATARPSANASSTVRPRRC